ncbi:hypothetical protein HRbin01_00017 [archaeon HR01]|nr:hypothetical protein HRbin01_00017 [archaeon HR01]
MLAVRVIQLVKDILGDRLVSAIIFGSLAAGRFNEESDIDLLFVVEDFGGKSMAARIEEIAPAFEKLRETSEYNTWKKETGKPTIPDINPIIYTKEEIKKHPPIMLDLVYDGEIIYDVGDFIKTELKLLERRLNELGARRITNPDGTWYWILSPRIRRGEAIEI